MAAFVKFPLRTVGLSSGAQLKEVQPLPHSFRPRQLDADAAGRLEYDELRRRAFPKNHRQPTERRGYGAGGAETGLPYQSKERGLFPDARNLDDSEPGTLRLQPGLAVQR
jgi:hypothetical protein